MALLGANIIHNIIANIIYNIIANIIYNIIANINVCLNAGFV